MTTILFLHHAGIRGGAGTMLVNIVKSLDREKFRAIVVCPMGDLVEDLKRLGIEVIVAPKTMRKFPHVSAYTWPAYSRWFYAEALRQRRDIGYWTEFIRGIGPDIVHLDSLTLAPLAESARRAGCKVVCLVQETFAPGTFGIRTAWLKNVLSTKMDAVAFISDYDRRQARCRAPIVEVIPNWVDLAHYDRSLSKDEMRTRLQIPPQAKMVLFLGGVARTKGTLPLLQALGHLRDMDDVLLCIGGYRTFRATSQPSMYRRLRSKIWRTVSGGYEDRVEEFIKQNRLEHNVRFLGMISDPMPWYAAADVVAFPVTEPHQGRPILEAGAMGKPAICSDFECVREFAKDGENVILAPPGDPVALADALRKILGDPDLARRMGEANYRMTLQNHNAAINAPKFGELYERVMQLRRGEVVRS
jgi:glycosyltransferase involved in cell wall biosynthesis